MTDETKSKIKETPSFFRSDSEPLGVSANSTTSETSDQSEGEQQSDNSRNKPNEYRPYRLRTMSGHARLIDRITTEINEGFPFYSLEFFPPKTATGAANLFAKFEILGKGKPLFCDVTWSSSGDMSCLDKPTSSLMIAGTILNYCGFDTVLHITGLGYTKEQVRDTLQKARRLGIENILALRGDKPPSNAPGDFKHAVDLLRFIRSEFGKQFVVGVAGYPNPHPEAVSYEEDMQHLKEKVDAGADFIITQLFFKPEQFLSFVSDCRRLGIACPILPGIFPIQAYQSLTAVTRLAKIKLPDEIAEVVHTIKDNDEAVVNYGIEHATALCMELARHGHRGLHFYTLNRETVVIEILKRLHMWQRPSPERPLLPWKRSGNARRRAAELVRPIFWSERTNTYLYRTSGWTSFPNGRWSDTSNPDFGDLNDYYLFYLSLKRSLTPEELRHQWLEELQTEQDISHVFCSFLSGQPNRLGHKVTVLPWSDSAPASETNVILDKLLSLNARDVWTTNSQPAVDGVHADHPAHGWGPCSDGYVYQKAYLEFFLPTRLVPALLRLLAAPRYSLRINYHILDAAGGVNESNCRDRPIAVTWGVFPGREVLQPTVVDPHAFNIWKQEAFDLWIQEWARIYPADSPSYKLIESVVASRSLVNLVDNDYRAGNKCLFELLDELLALPESSLVAPVIKSSLQPEKNGLHTTVNSGPVLLNGTANGN